jgi:hypothetical protein
MRVILLTAASALALGAAGCARHGDYAHRTALDCPDHQGQLERTGIAPDRKSCTYKARDGAEVTLRLTPVSGDAPATLGAVEASLVGPASAKPLAAGEAATPAPPPTPRPPAPPAASGDAARAAAEASRDAGAASDQDWNSGRHHGVTIEHGEKGVVAHGDDGDAHINLPGMHIDAEGDNATVDIGGIHVDANQDQATMHVIRDVRLRGEAFSRERNGVRATFFARRDDLPDGYRFVGYQAAGPKTGPLAVAVVKSREASPGDRLYRDVARLVRRNGGA